MNTKKNKSKGRGKTTKTTQETVSAGAVENIDNIEEVSDNLDNEENRVPEIINECDTHPENEQMISDVPKKPKRGKLKKKKDALTADIKNSEQDEIIKGATEIGENIQNITEEIIQIIPSVRKKKKKAKKIENKSKEQVELNMIECVENDSDKKIKIGEDKYEYINKIGTENIDITPKDDSQSKKKKKKKHSQDPCTLDFQKLLEPVDVLCKTENTIGEPQIQSPSNNVLTIENSSEAILFEKNKMQEKCDGFEFNKITQNNNNKKDKKHLPKGQPCAQEEVEVSSSEMLIPEIHNKDSITSSESFTQTTETKESSPKPKAKIAKPVKKKRKTQAENESESTSSHSSHNLTGESITKDIDQNIDNKYLERGGGDETVEKRSPLQNDFDKEVITTSSSEKSEMLNIKGDSSSTFRTNQCCTAKQGIEISENSGDGILDRNQEKEFQLQYQDDKSTLGFVDGATNKTNDAKRNENNLFFSDTSGTSEMKVITDIQHGDDIKNLDINCQKVEPKILHDTESHTEQSAIKDIEEDIFQLNIPDRIEYPRSSSQQFIDDNNNNTLIQEIVSPDQVNLGIPISILTPIIKGSGESPDAHSTPINFNVTEIFTQSENIVSQPKESVTVLRCTADLSHEKTDIKSKIIEVNQDMEELKMSIEKSLAEFSVIENTERGVDKNCETLLIQNIDSRPHKVNNDKIINPEYKCTVSEEQCNFKEADKRGCENNNNDLKDELTENLIEEPNQINERNKNLEKTMPSSDISSVVLDDNDDQKLVTENITPVCPARRERGKNKPKKKNKKEIMQVTPSTSTTNTTMTSTCQCAATESTKKSEKSEQKSESTQGHAKQQALSYQSEPTTIQNSKIFYEPIENFEEALSSSVDDVNKTFEIIVEDANKSNDFIQYHTNPQINVIAPAEATEQEENTQKNNEQTKKQTPVSLPKNLLGHPNIPASSNKNDFKKEKNKFPNLLQAKVKIKNVVDIEKFPNEPKNSKKKLLKDCNQLSPINFTYTDESLIYKYSFRKVFLQSMCHVCQKYLIQRVPCNFCALVFYCGQKHKDEDWSQHQSLCSAVSTITHLKGLKHVYADTQNIVGHDFRVLRMQMILSCEKILNRKLLPWEQEALLYPRLCSEDKCRQWKQGCLKDCEGCGQVSYCIDHPNHLPPSHQRWCKFFALYQKLVNYQQTKGRLDPPVPTKVLKHYQMPGKLNEVLGSMYENKIEIDDIQYAALTQLATAPLTAAYCHQLFSGKMNSTCANGVGKKSTFTIHITGVELPFEADSLNKWEIFFLHLRSDIQTLRVVMVGQDLNTSKLPLDVLKKIKLCGDCQAQKRNVVFDFRDNERYNDYYLSEDFVKPDIVCAFNANIERTSIYNPKIWPSAINCILKQRVPFVITAYTIEELRRDLGKVRRWADEDFNVVSEMQYNPFCSVRPDRNFITDHEMPLLLKNYCFCILCGVL